VVTKLQKNNQNVSFLRKKSLILHLNPIRLALFDEVTHHFADSKEKTIMKQKKLMMLALMLVTLLLTGCVQKHRVQHHPSHADTLYTESKAMDIYGQDPLRALQIIDSAEVVGNLSAFRARVNDQLQAGQAHNYAARYQAQELQMALQKENAAKSRNSLINIIFGLAFCFTLAFLLYFFRQRRVLKRKNRILVRQITEAMKYKDMYRKQSQNLPKEGEDASRLISGQDSPVPAPTSNASTVDGQTPAKKSICTPKTHPITQKTNEAPSGAVGGLPLSSTSSAKSSSTNSFSLIPNSTGMQLWNVSICRRNASAPLLRRAATMLRWQPSSQLVVWSMPPVCCASSPRSLSHK